MAFVSSLSSTNEVNTTYGVSTANTQVNPASTQVSTTSTQVSTANLVMTLFMHFWLVNQTILNLLRMTLETNPEDNIEKIRFKNAVTLLDKMTRSFFQKTGRNITINGRTQLDMTSPSYMADDEKSSTNMAIYGFFRPEPKFVGYGPKPSKSVSEDTSNEGKESPDVPLVKELVSDDKLEKKIVFPTVAKMEFANCNYYQRERVISRNNYTRENYNYSAKKTHPSAQRNMVPRAVLMKTGLRSLNTARLVNTAHPKTTIYSVRQMPKAVNNARPNSAVVNAVRANQTSRNLMEDMLPLGDELKKGKLLGLIVQGEGLTIPVESHHTPTCAPLTSQPHLSLTVKSSIRQETEVPQPSSPHHTNVADEATFTGVDVRYEGAATTVTGLEVGQGSGNIDKTPTISHDLPLPRVNILGSDEGRMQHNELMNLVTKLSDRVVALEINLTQTKKFYGAAFTKLIKKVKRLEKKDKLNKSRRKLRLVLSDKEGSDSDILAPEDPSKQGRKIDQIDEDKGITLVHMGVSTASIDFTTANVPVTTAGVEISTAGPEVKTTGDSVDDIAAKRLVYIRRIAAKTKDKGKGIMEESESAITKTKRQQEQERLEWEDIQAKIEVDEELTHMLQAEEREKYSKAEKARLLTELINQRKRHFAQQRAEERRNKPPTQAQQRTYMSNYIKHMGSYTLQQLRGYSFDEIKSLFEAKMKRVNTFTPMKSDVDKTVPKIAAGSTKRAAKE
ncbi:hypothetical protein Tco_0920480 [Tanacetum coccineum]